MKPLYTDRDIERVVPTAYPSDADEPYRTPWRRDYARLIHSPAFRRLEGKTQLFPREQSDFFRNRLTHSLEVAQIAKSIAVRVNNTCDYFQQYPIDTDLVETAALAHDLGHPPFGHNGEEALNDCMKKAGGFEGNAQTLRILTKLEKRDTLTRTPGAYSHDSVLNGVDNRAGLNLTYRTLASVLKYDHRIPHHVQESSSLPTRVYKGYYFTEYTLVQNIKEHVAPGAEDNFKTIECSIMDIADDIAYSTYDLEDAFKAGFLTPLGMLSAEPDIIGKVARTVKARLDAYYPELPVKEREFESNDVYNNIYATFSSIFMIDENFLSNLDLPHRAAVIADRVTRAADKIRSVGFYRTKFTSDIVGELIRSVELRFNKDWPMLSSVRLEAGLFKKMEVLKNFAFEALIMSPRLRVTEHRGKDIVREIFGALIGDSGYLLMPEDFQWLFCNLRDTEERRRVVCDFIAGMTDRYAVNFYARLFGANPESFFTPL